MLLLIPRYADIVGSVILPVLGAVPDGCIVLFSGMGDDAQNELSVGVGALVGSTIMLLTIPWYLSIMGGRVPLSQGLPNYRSRLTPDEDTPTSALHTSGISISPIIGKGAVFMLITSVSYLVLQVPGLFLLDLSPAEQSAGERKYSIIGLVMCILFLSW